MEILLFGIAKDIVGRSSFRFEEGDEVPKSVLELKQKLNNSFPDFGKLSSLAIAVNSEYAQDGKSLQRGDEIAVIPPVSGG
ncbi:MoaD/ThiS family protein [Zobellia uliginosa]|uniref:MoaD/ThiS family protein n=1 Tax=Zobellia uliginosa TaxID=143224 RepID=UPI001C0675CD|nr:MoaD/ThiS family protein [Zobellia uliginosa]MBU2945571.1 MoaD/ThiS family protein [Zobellia uliginosa]